ncbi:MAG: peptidylprolyl isomerase [Campylobacterales bacterium]
MGKIILFLMLFVGLYAQVVDGIAVVVKGQAITMYDIQQEMKKAKVDAKKATSILVRKKLEDIEIKKRGIDVSPIEVYSEIKKMAEKNNLTINQFYDAIRSSRGITSDELKKTIKRRILNQKLHAAIAYSHISAPTEDEMKDYFNLHKSEFKNPSSFEVILYHSNNRQRLQQKINNPMLYAPDIQTSEQTLPFNKINPKLAQILKDTKPNTFTPIVQNADGQFMSFYLKDIKTQQEVTFDSVKNQIANAIMDAKREQTLSDYFARLQQSADITVLRMP